LMKQNPQRQRSLSPALETAAQLRTEMIEIFGWNTSQE